MSMVGLKPALRVSGLRGLLQHRSSLGQTAQSRSSTTSYPANDEDPFYKLKGNRELVGHGINGTPSYIDCEDYPFPAIRYRECTPELMVFNLYMYRYILILGCVLMATLVRH